MNNITKALLTLLFGVLMSSNVSAWTRIPAAPTDEEMDTTKIKKIKPEAAKKSSKSAAPTTTAIQPTQPKSIVPVPVPAIAPATAPSKPAVIKPSVVPSQPSQPKPVVLPQAKSQPPRAKSKSQQFEWMVGAGYETGGEELGQVTYSDGSTASVNANNGIVLNIGGLIPNDDKGSFTTQVSIGYKSGGPRLWNTDVNWSAIPVDIIEHYRANSFRMGLGLSYQLNPRLQIILPTSSIVNKYNNALGLIIQIGWMPARENFSIDLRYTSIKFQSSDVPDAPAINGSVASLFLNYHF